MKPIQGSIFCRACGGEKFFRYKDFLGILRVVKCPICKGTGLDSFKGKVIINPKQ